MQKYMQIYCNLVKNLPFLLLEMLTKTPGMAYYEIALSWYNSDGTQEYIDNVEVTKDTQTKTPVISENNDYKRINENLPFLNTETKDIGELSDDENDKDEDDDKNDKEDGENEDDKDEEDDKE
jgi:hypothetical protein